MIHSRFEQQATIPATDPEVVVRAASQEAEISALMAYIDHFDQSQPAILPVKTSDRLMMVKTADIILADIQQGQLLLYTSTGIIESKESLVHLQLRLASPDFVQVSKHAVLNLNHLFTLSDSFSGNMTATLANHVKTDVSRKYVKSLMQSLGI